MDTSDKTSNKIVLLEKEVNELNVPLYKYSCAFCKTEYSNRSTHNIHLKSEEHTEVRLVVQLKLERLNKKHLQKDYGTTNVNDILDVYENVCHVEWNI